MPGPCIIVLNGFPGVGKSTIAQHLRNLHISETGNKIRVVDNHLLIDPAEALFDGDRASPMYWELRRELQRVTLEAAKASCPEHVTVFTTCLATNEKDEAVFAGYVDLAKSTKLPTLFINLTCSDAVQHEARLTHTDRQMGKKKLGDAKVLREIVEQHTLLRLNERLEIAGAQIQLIEYDTSGKTVTETAEAIWTMCEDFSSKLRDNFIGR